SRGTSFGAGERRPGPWNGAAGRLRSLQLVLRVADEHAARAHEHRPARERVAIRAGGAGPVSSGRRKSDRAADRPGGARRRTRAEHPGTVLLVRRACAAGARCGSSGLGWPKLAEGDYTTMKFSWSAACLTLLVL